MPPGKFGESSSLQQQNLDKIETICEVSHSTSSTSNATNNSSSNNNAESINNSTASSSKSSTMVRSHNNHDETSDNLPSVHVATPNPSSVSNNMASGFRDRFRHCSESAAALVQRLPPFRTSLLAVAASKEEDKEERAASRYVKTYLLYRFRALLHYMTKQRDIGHMKVS